MPSHFPLNRWEKSQWGRKPSKQPFPTPTLTLRIFITCLSEKQLKSVAFVQSMEIVAIQNRLSPLILKNWKLWNKCWFVGMYTRWGKGYNKLHDICLFWKSPKCLLANDRSTVGKSEEKSRYLLNLFDIAKNQGISLQNFVPKHMAGLRVS